MNPDTIFQFSNTLALFSWMLLILTSPFWYRITSLLPGITVVLLASAYTLIILTNFHWGDWSKFSTLAGLKTLFDQDLLLAAGWIHYLAFDLLIGCHIVNNARVHGISHWLVVPCLLCTFMLGPLGWLLYRALRVMRTKQYFQES